ncbi:hypothetical protein [Agrococcus casei]|uniref:hypothetical protein n=1 Tax=Agrococcus casei TaxID=343512 RepID=UPI003F8FC06B
MSDIRLSYDDLRGAVTNLEYVATQFEASGDTADACADATAHDQLAGRVREFADNWDDNRRKFTTAADDLAAAIEQVHDAFKAFDHDSASG